jgi:hypothetical protein
MPGLITGFQDRKLVSPQAFEQGSNTEAGPLIDLRESLRRRECDGRDKGQEGGE